VLLLALPSPALFDLHRCNKKNRNEEIRKKRPREGRKEKKIAKERKRRSGQTKSKQPIQGQTCRGNFGNQKKNQRNWAWAQFIWTPKAQFKPKAQLHN
jgi:hypothetical protein